MSSRELHAYGNQSSSGRAPVSVESNSPHVLSRAWRGALVVAYALALLFLSACSTAGTGNLNAEITKDRVSASLKLGANMSGPWRGKVLLKKSVTESTVEISGQGSNVNRTPGHEATKEMVKDGVAATGSLARRGFVPGL